MTPSKRRPEELRPVAIIQEIRAAIRKHMPQEP